MAAGFLLLLGHVAIALSGTAMPNFVSGLVLLGVGWNFAYVGGTALLTTAYRPAERHRAQAINDFAVFGCVALASLSAGWLQHAFGWQALNLAAVPFIAVALAATLVLIRDRHRCRPALEGDWTMDARDGPIYLDNNARRTGRTDPPAGPIYLDYNATTPIEPAVVEAMLPYLRERFGNPSSAHEHGIRARAAVETARGEVARLVRADAGEIVFTSGGTEATNYAIKGAAFAAPERAGEQVVISAVEHPATQETARFVERFGFKRVVVDVDRYGVVDLDALERALRAPTLLVSVMHANNETGSVQPIAGLAGLAHARGALLHVDAAQSAGKVEVDVAALGADLLTLAGHKLYAPKGIGALYVRRGVQLEPFIHGAGQESGRRAGTENVPYIVALGEACRIARETLPETGARMQRLRDRLWAHLHEGLRDRVALNGHPERRLPNTLNASFIGHVGSELLAAIPEIAASTGSACHEGQVSISPVLAAMRLDPAVARGAVRLTVGRYTTEAEVDRAAALLVERAGR